MEEEIKKSHALVAGIKAEAYDKCIKTIESSGIIIDKNIFVLRDLNNALAELIKNGEDPYLIGLIEAHINTFEVL